METKPLPGQRHIALQRGEAFALDASASAHLIVTQGAVRLHSRARWIANSVVFAPSQIVVAPAMVACGDFGSAEALEDARMQLEQPVTWTGKMLGWLRASGTFAPAPSRA